MDVGHIYIHKSNNEIIIYQDNIGSYGIYCYKKNSFFALSNSFFLLVSYLVDIKKIPHWLSTQEASGKALTASTLASLFYLWEERK